MDDNRNLKADLKYGQDQKMLNLVSMKEAQLGYKKLIISQFWNNDKLGKNSNFNEKIKPNFKNGDRNEYLSTNYKFKELDPLF